MDSTTSETIARTIDEFSFIFTGLPPRLSSCLPPTPPPLPPTPPSVCSYHYHRTQKGNMPPTNFYDTYPLPFPKQTSQDDLLHLSPTTTCSSSTTTTETAFDRSYDTHLPDGRRAIPSFSSSPGTPTMPPHLPPRPSSTLTTTNSNTLQQRSGMYYTKLPHFHPPRFSRRLRNLIAERRRPGRLRLASAPTSRERRPPPDEEKAEGPYWVITASPGAGGSSPTMTTAASKKRMYMRLILIFGFAGVVGGVIVLVLSMTVGWRR